MSERVTSSQVLFLICASYSSWIDCSHYFPCVRCSIASLKLIGSDSLSSTLLIIVILAVYLVFQLISLNLSLWIPFSGLSDIRAEDDSGVLGRVYQGSIWIDPRSIAATDSEFDSISKSRPRSSDAGSNTL